MLGCRIYHTCKVDIRVFVSLFMRNVSINRNDNLSWSKKSPSRKAECTSPTATFHTGIIKISPRENMEIFVCYQPLNCLPAVIFWGSLNTPDECCDSDADSVGFIFLTLPILAPRELFLVFFLLSLSSTAPNYPRRPHIRSSKAHPIEKIWGKFYPPLPNLASAPSCNYYSWNWDFITNSLFIGNK